MPSSNRLRMFLLALAVLPASAIAQPPPTVIPDRGNDDFDSVRVTPKIVGGETAPPGTYPWQVSLQRSDMPNPLDAHFCSGSIRSATWIVTAAHCAVNLVPTDVEVIAGTQTLDRTVKRLSVERIVVHKDYTRKAHDYDVALIKLGQPLAFRQGLQPIGPTTVDPVEGRFLFVTGWGATSEGGTSVRTLRHVQVPKVATEDCRNPYAYGRGISDRMICAGDAQGGRDSCQGDSGGPLSTSSSGPNSELVGVVSWGDGCAKPGKPGVYARISVLNAWIERCMADSDHCQ